MNTKKQSSTVSRMWEITKGGRTLYLLALVLVVLNIVFQFLLPQMIGFVVDSITGDRIISRIPIVKQLMEWMHANIVIPDNLILVSVLTLLVAFGDALTGFLSKWVATISSEGMIKRLRDRIYNHIQHLPYSWHIGVQTGDIIQRATTDVEIIRMFITNQLTEMVKTILLIFIAYIILFPMNYAMALASIAFLPFIFLFSFGYVLLMAKRYEKVEHAEGQLTSIAQENLTGVRVVRAFGREQGEVEHFAKANHTYAKLWRQIGNLLGAYNGIAEIIIAVQMLVVCYIGVQQAALGNITAGTFIVFISYNAMTVWPVRALGRIFSEASKTKVAVDRIWEILDSPLESEAPNALYTPISGDIVFDSVSFSYPEQKVLENVSFTAREGSTLGILGTTGSGKSTVALLLCRLYDLELDDGTISIGGTDITKYNRQWLRKNVGIVLQEPFLFSRSIGENIAALSTDYTPEEIGNAAKVASIDDAILEFTEGYDTLVGERGVSLSGGQRQRVAISRLILSNPPIMIFDDSLSAVDTETDLKIRRGLAKQRQNTTTIIISHRVSSLSDSELILYMEEGKIIEQGTHEELMALEQNYYRIYNMQESTQKEVDDLG